MNLSLPNINSNASNLNLTGTLANRPAAGIPGRIYLPTDGYPICRDNGSSWDTYLNGFKYTAPPAASSLSQIHFTLSAGSSSLSNINGGLLFSQTGNNSTSNRDGAYAVTAIPGSGTYSLTVGFQFLLCPMPFTWAGICFTDGTGATPKIIVFSAIQRTTVENPRLAWMYENSPTALGSEGALNFPCGSFNSLFLRITDDRTNLRMYYSLDGSNFIWTGWAPSRTSYLTPSHCGIVLGQTGNTTAIPITETRSIMKIFHWSLV